MITTYDSLSPLLVVMPLTNTNTNRNPTLTLTSTLTVLELIKEQDVVHFSGMPQQSTCTRYCKQTSAYGVYRLEQLKAATHGRQ